MSVPEQPELTIQGWGPAAGPRAATGTRGADGGHGTPELTAFPDLAEVLPRAARRHLARELGWTPRRTPPAPVADIRLAPSRLAEDCRLRLVELLGEEHARTGREVVGTSSRGERTGEVDGHRDRSGAGTGRL